MQIMPNAVAAITDMYLAKGQQLISYRDHPKGQFRRNSCIEIRFKDSNDREFTAVVNGSLFSLVSRYSRLQRNSEGLNKLRS